MNRLLALLSVGLLFSLSVVQAQDYEDINHGPRAGKVVGKTSPQAEVLRSSEDTVKIYFIDRNWVDVSTDGVSVKTILFTKKTPKGLPTPCKLENNYFKCQFPKENAPDVADTLKITRDQKGAESMDYEYKFIPLKH